MSDQLIDVPGSLAIRIEEQGPMIPGAADKLLAIADEIEAAAVDKAPWAHRIRECVQGTLQDAPIRPHNDGCASWDDSRIQIVYGLLVSGEAPPNPEEHWEGWIARRIVAELSIRQEGYQAGKADAPVRIIRASAPYCCPNCGYEEGLP